MLRKSCLQPCLWPGALRPQGTVPIKLSLNKLEKSRRFTFSLVLVYPIPLEALHQIIPSLRSEYFCASVQIAYWLGLAQSGLFLTALNADRFIFFHWPLKYILLTKTYVIAICATIATVIIGYVVLAYLFTLHQSLAMGLQSRPGG